MSKIIFYTDLHCGGNHQLINNGKDISLWGELALDMASALNHYAKNNRCDVIIHGGDETFYDEDPGKHFVNAQETKKVICNTSRDVIRAIGNHEPLNPEHMDSLNFTPYGAVPNSPLGIFVAQPQIVVENGVTLYEYPESMPQDIINTANKHDGSLIVAGHFAFDRHEQGYPKIYPPERLYAYRETLNKQKEYSFEQPIPLNQISNPNGQILSLHGHEHRYRLTTQGMFNSLTMPSISQQDALNPGRPCGLFCEIDKDDKTSAFSIIYKKITLNENNHQKYTVRKVSQDYMHDNYHRPVIPEV